MIIFRRKKAQAVKAQLRKEANDLFTKMTMYVASNIDMKYTC